MVRAVTAADLGHLLPADVWAAVVAQAEVEAARIAAGGGAQARRDLFAPLTTGALPLSGVVTAARHGGARKAPTFGVIHSAETPLRAGYAASIARMFATTTQDKSCHYMTDPAETWGVLDDLLVAWHVGGANPNSLGLEQAGMAAMTREQWLVPEGIAQMRRNGAVMRAARDRYGIGLFWNTDQQLRDAHARRVVAGWSWHDQCRVVIGGTTHTDPGRGFPFDVQMQIALDDDLAPGGFLMALNDQQQTDLLSMVGALHAVVVSPVKGATGELLDRSRTTDAGVAALLARKPGATITAADVAAAIPDGLAQDVVDQLVARLTRTAQAQA